VDLNSDLGETVAGVPTADDDAMFELITSANIACGFHAGDAESMRASCERAARTGVTIGAHVSYRDPVSFGRTDIPVARDTLVDDVLEQLTALQAVASCAGTGIRYVKPHGALYNRIMRDPVRADAVAEAIARFSPGLPLMGLAGSAAEQAAERHGLPFVHEAFADRAYLRDGSLVPRTRPGAVLRGGDEVARRATSMVTEGRVVAIDGTELRVSVRSLCIHGDTEGSVEMARAVRRSLEAAGVTIAAFA